MQFLLHLGGEQQIRDPQGSELPVVASSGQLLGKQ